MAIQAGQTAAASDFITTSAGAGDSGKVPKLGANGKLDASVSFTRFGGTGADGALNVTSGNTNIDCGGAQVVIKNYSSISITGTGSITFINPHNNGTVIVLKSQGNVTLTSSATPMLSAVGMGAAGGPVGGGPQGVVGTNGLTPLIKTNTGVGWQDAGGGSLGPGSGANGGVAAVFYLNSGFNWSQIFNKYPFVFVGAGGGGGATNSGSAGAGGNGGGGLIIECAGAWNFTTTNGISVKGQAGYNASSTGFPGSGGGAGSFLALYNTLTSSTGTVAITGGAAGTGGLGSSNSGGTGFSSIAKNTEFA